MTGQRGASSDAVSSSSRPPLEQPQFDMVLRGYDRIEVDEYIAALLEENAALRRELESRAAQAERQPQAPPAAAPESPQHYAVDTPAEDSFGFRAEKLLRILLKEGALIKVTEDLIFHASALAQLRELVTRRKLQSDRIDVAVFKELTGLTRKYAIPLLEYLDRERVTRRVGDENARNDRRCTGSARRSDPVATPGRGNGSQVLPREDPRSCPRTTYNRPPPT